MDSSRFSNARNGLTAKVRYEVLFFFSGEDERWEKEEAAAVENNGGGGAGGLQAGVRARLD